MVARRGLDVHAKMTQSSDERRHRPGPHLSAGVDGIRAPPGRDQTWQEA